MHLVLSVLFMVIIATVGYCLWVFEQDIQYWRGRCRELEEQLDRVSDMERLEAIAQKTKQYNAEKGYQVHEAR